jgi:hypothetical protein
MLAAAACQRPSALSRPNAADLTPAEARWQTLEQRLLAAQRIHVTATVAVQGTVAAQLQGSLLIEGKRVLLGFEGELAGKQGTIELRSDGSFMSGGSASLRFEQDEPPELRRGLIAGVARMGIFYHLIVLATGNPPQGTYGGVSSWITIDGVRTGGDGALLFDVAIGGRRAASTELWLSPETDLPLRRQQEVTFDAGRMTVVEDYEQFEVVDRAP